MAYRIRIAENFRAVFYAPCYAMRVLDLAAAEGVQLEWVEYGSPGSAIDDLKRGAVDLCWGGPMRVMKDHDAEPDDEARLLCFGQIVGRDPFYLVGAAGATDGFALPALAGLRLGVVSEVPTPWLCLQEDMREHGVDPRALADAGQVVTGLTMAQQRQWLEEGRLDAMQCFEPYASQAIADGVGSLLYAASTRGPTLYTTFVCTHAGMARHGEAYAALARALGATQAWMAAQGPAALARLVAPFFEQIPAPLLLASIERYYRDGIWDGGVEVSRAGIERLALSLHGGGFIRSPVTYEACVRNI